MATPSETETIQAAGSAADVADLDTEASPTSAPRDSVHALSRGRVLGRYVILELLGRGGMGTVYSAFDPDLDRRVAIKLLRFTTPGYDAGAAQARLLREAQVMGKLRHPNVVSVYDVGRYDDAVFVAMEHVDGETLRAYLRRRDRSREPSDLLRIFIAAGEGLAAAHDSGVVHRDFKPDNVMIDRDGRVVVLDFGLAAPPSSSSVSAESSASGTTVGDLTATGQILGTPAYMSPEQMLGTRVEAASDQFSFCVALYEAVHGGRPFRGDTLPALRENVLLGRIAPVDPAERRDVPRWLRGVLARGLSRLPADRFASMRELLTALRDTPARRRRRLAALAGVVLVGSGAIAAGARRGPDPCESAGAAIEATWNDAKRVALESAISAVPVPYAAEAATHASATLADYAASWSERRVAACEDHRIAAVPSDDLHARRSLCLDERLYAFDAIVAGLLEPDARTLAGLPNLLSSLPDLSLCEEERWLLAGARPPEDPAVAAEIEAIRRELSRLLVRSRRLPPGALVGEGAALTERARATGYSAVIGDTLVGELWLGMHSRPDEELRATVFDARIAGERAGNDQTIFDAMLEQAKLERRTEHLHDAERTLEIAEAVLHRLGEPVSLRIQILQERAHIAVSRYDHEGALAALETIVELRREDGSDDSVYMLNQAVRLAEVDLQLRRIPEARAALGQGFALAERFVGPSHPMVVALHILSARLSEADGDPEGVLRSAQRAEALLPEDDAHNRVLVRQLVATALAMQGRLDEAQAEQVAALDLARDALGEDHILTAIHAANLGFFLADRGRFDDAAPHLQRARASLGAKLGDRHANTRLVTAILGDTLREAGRPEEAAQLYDKAMEPDASGDVATLRAGIGLAVLALDDGRADEAVAQLERALTQADPDEDRSIHARVELVLARALTAAGGSTSRAIELARHAAADLETNETLPELRDEARAWLRAHDPEAADR